MAVTSSTALRRSKTHFYHADGSGDGGYAFDTLQFVQDKYGTSVAGAQGGSITLCQIALPQDCVIVKIAWGAAAVTSTVAADNLVHVSVQDGTGMLDSGLAFPASGAGVVAPQTYPTANSTGNFLFATPKNFYSVAGGSIAPVVTAQIVPDNPDAWYRAGERVVLQVKTTAGGGLTAPITLALLIACFDPKQYSRKDADPTAAF